MNPKDAPYVYLFILGDEEEHYYNVVSAQAWSIDQATNVLTERLGASLWDNVCILKVLRWNPDIYNYEKVWSRRVV